MSTPTMDLLITGAQIFHEGALRRGNLAVAGGRIVLVGNETPAAAQVIDAPGCWVLPGMIDTHVHFREPGRTDKEDFESGTRSAVLGGVTSVLEIQNNEPLITDVDSLRAKHALVGPKARCHYGIYANVGLENLHKLQAMAADACAFKVFMTQSVGPLTVTGIGDLWRAMKAVRPTGRVLAVHAEADSVCKVAKEGLPDDFASHARSRPALAEAIAVGEALELCAATGTPINLAHLSTARSVELVADAKRRGLPISAATCAHYLAWTEADTARSGSVFKVNPPIKSESDRVALLQGLRDGCIDHLHSDHAPHTPAEKSLSWRKSPSGIAGIQHQLQFLLQLERSGELPLADLVRCTGTAPAAAFGLRERGEIRTGFHADIVLVDPNRAVVVTREDLATRAANTPWMGHRFESSIRATIVGGRVAMLDGVVSEGFHGQRLQPATVP